MNIVDDANGPGNYNGSNKRCCFPKRSRPDDNINHRTDDESNDNGEAAHFRHFGL
jgi:hypothetical protein